MKNWWRNAFALSAAVTAITMVAMMVVTVMSKNEPAQQQFVPRVPTSGTVQSTPSRVLSSVLIYNGDIQGSGTVISKGEQYAAVLTAAHSFKGKIGGEFWLYYPDGTFTAGTLVAHDPERDLALAKVDASTIVGHSFVPKEMPESTQFTCVGYSNGQGPNMNELSYNSTFRNASNKFMWDITLTNGNIWDGASGGGVFLGDACIGVTSERDSLVYVSHSGSYIPTKKMYATCHQELLNFLNENKEVLSDCGDWSVEPVASYGENENLPPLWTPNPNVPINLPSGNIASLQEDVKSLKKVVFGDQKRPNDILPEKDGPSTPLIKDEILPTVLPDEISSLVPEESDGPSTPLPEGYFDTEGLKKPSDVGDTDVEDLINDFYKKK